MRTGNQASGEKVIGCDEDAGFAKDSFREVPNSGPGQKDLTFGGDRILVELALGHARIARSDLALALSELIVKTG